MKKQLLSLCLILMLALSMTAHAASDALSAATPASAPVTVTGSDGEEATVTPNPKTVAIYDYAVLDILLSVGFENTGIERLIVPNKDKLPDELSYYREQPDDKVVSGGTLFYVDWDVLDIVQPELVILGARSFGVNAAGADMSADEKAALRAETLARYEGTAFVRLSMTTANAQMTVDMENNVAVLAAIFPDLAPALNAKLDEVLAAIGDIRAKVQASGKTALFCMMVNQTTLSVFNPDSRFDMLYEEFGFAPVDGEAVAWEDSHGFDVRAEYVLEKNPDVIFLLDRSATVGTGAGAENFMNDPIIQKTGAAQNGTVYTLSGNAWYTMTGGFSAVAAMISDVNQYVSTLG